MLTENGMGKVPESGTDRKLRLLAAKYGLSKHLLDHYHSVFKEHNMPVYFSKRTSARAGRIVMVSTHGYWGDPPPAGVPDTGGQTYYVLKVSKAWADRGRKVIILARWFKPYPVVESFAKNLWLVRIPAGGSEFIRKEDIYPFLPELAEQAVAVAALFGAHAVMGHYADGMAIAVETGERLAIPTVVIPHSLGVNKAYSLGFDLNAPETWLGEEYHFGTRETFELAALKGANFEIANTWREPEMLRRYYGQDYPHLVMPAGAGNEFFHVREASAEEDLEKYDLVPHRYIIYFGRFSAAKNVPGVVTVFGEARKLAPKVMNGMKLVLIGGAPEKTLPEEADVDKDVTAAIDRFHIPNSDVVRLPSQPWSVLAIFARYSLCYLGMQKMEPFGMGVAEAMAAGAPVIISNAAGITKWLADNVNAVVVDPDDPKGAARRLVDLVNSPTRFQQMAEQGHTLARTQFSWDAIGEKLADVIDCFCRGASPDGDGTVIHTRKIGRAYHRAAFAWRGDPPMITPVHEKAAKALEPLIVSEARAAGLKHKRVVVALGGESGAGKTEIAEYLRYLLRRQKLQAATISGDAFFKLSPSENHQARLRAFADHRLETYLGPQEVRLETLNRILGHAIDRDIEEVIVPSDCRTLGSRRYENVPVDLSHVDVVIVDLTYSPLLTNATMRVFLESDYHRRIKELKARNLARDPDQDFRFILKVLEIEHEIITKMKVKADFIISKKYDVTASRTARH